MKRKILSVLFLLLYLCALPLTKPTLGGAKWGSVFAQAITNPIPTGTWYNPSLKQFTDKVMLSPDQEIFGERYTYAQVNWIIHSLSLMLNIDFTSSEVLNKFNDFFTYQSTPTTAEYMQLGLPGILIGSMSEIYSSPPASGTMEIARFFDKFSIASPAFAQGGYGYDSSEALRGLWTASRNTSYFFMVILLVAAGFMIMFRVKINPQTAISLQTMIPKIIVTLVLVTFSYAIAGLMIDLTYLLVTLFLSSLTLPGVGIIDAANLGSAVSFFTGGFAKIFFFYFFSWLAFVLSPISLLTILPAIIGLIIGVVVIWLVIKIWWLLMKTYVQILFAIIIAPWQILLGLLPGQNGFTTWLKGLAANLSVFVVVPIMLTINIYLWSYDGGIFATYQAISDFLRLGWTPNINHVNATYQVPSLPIFGGKSFGMYFLASMAIMALIPKVAEIIKDALKVSKFKYGTAFTEPLTDVRGRYDSFVAGQKADAEKKPGERVFMSEGITGEAKNAYRNVRSQFSSRSSGSGGGPDDTDQGGV